MKIVLFDDSKSDREKLYKIISDWIKRNDCSDIIVKQFERMNDLKFAFDELVFSDVFFLDIMTPESESTGFFLAEQIHLKNPNAVIIFTTNSREYMESAFEISAFRYLLKPVEREKIYAALDRIYHSPMLRSRLKAVLPGIFQEEVIDMDQIVYIEAKMRDHRAEIHLTDGNIKMISLTDFAFSQIPKEYLTDDFVQCHRSTIINLNYLTGFDQHSVFLCGKYELGIGRTYRADLVDRIIKHSKGEVMI